MSKYTTGELAKLCDVSVRTVQYYDNRGILIPSELSEGGRRLYSDADLSKMKLICFLRELDLSLDSIAKVMKEENSDEVIELILSEQERVLRDEVEDKQRKLERLRELKNGLKRYESVSVDNIGDVAKLMESKKQLRQIRITMLLSAIPIELVELGALALWIFMGVWWPFVVYTAIAIPYAVWVTRFYFKRVSYICPKCHTVFKPRFREAFWASHTPTTRKLTCPDCGYKGYCVETYYKNTQENEEK